MARSASFRLSMLLPSGRRFQAVLEALQDFLPDGFLDVCARDVAVVAAALGDSLKQRIDDSGLSPPVELLHEARLFLFGHGFVPFGKPYIFGSRQLALPATGRTSAARPSGLSQPVGFISPSGTLRRFMVIPRTVEGGRIKSKKPPNYSRGFTVPGVPLQWEACEQGTNLFRIWIGNARPRSRAGQKTRGSFLPLAVSLKATA